MKFECNSYFYAGPRSAVGRASAQKQEVRYTDKSFSFRSVKKGSCQLLAKVCIHVPCSGYKHFKQKHPLSTLVFGKLSIDLTENKAGLNQNSWCISAENKLTSIKQCACEGEMFVTS